MKIPGLNRQSFQPRKSAVCMPRFEQLEQLEQLGRRGRRSRRSRGAGLVELMVASLLLVIGIMGLVNTWAFSFRVTRNTDDKGIAYSIARQLVERIKMSGFTSTAEGTTTAYYTPNQAATSSTSTTAYFKVTTSVVSDMIQTGTAGVVGAVPKPEALRTVTVTVQTLSPLTTVHTTRTYLVRAGI